MFGAGLLVPWERGGVGGRRFLVLREGRRVVWPAVSAAVGARHAWRAWSEAGGARAMARETGKARRVEETRAAAKLVSHLLARGMQPSNLLRDMGSARKVVRATPRVQTRVLLNAEIAAGVVCDGRRRWALDCILAWRGGTERRNHTEALVRWLGFDRLTGAPHADTWVLRARLTADLRDGGKTVPKRTRAVAQLARARPAGARKLSRLAGEAPGELLDEALVRREARRKRTAEEAELAFREGAGDQRRSRRLGGLPTQMRI